MNDGPNPRLVSEFRSALNVMEERSHLGLDDEFASKLKRILLRRIAEAEGAFPDMPKSPLPVSRFVDLQIANKHAG